MIVKSHIQKFYDIQRYTPSSKDLKNLIADIKQYVPIVKILAHKAEISNASDLKNYVSYLASLLYETYTKNNSIGSLLYEHQAIENLIKNPKLIQQEYPKVKDSQNTHTVYTANLARSSRLALINALDEVSILEDFAEERNITATTSMESFANSDSPNFKKHYTSFINVLKAKSLNEKVLLMLKEEISQNEETSKNYLIDSLSVFCSFFNTLGILDSYLASYKYNSKKFNFADLQYDKSTQLNSKDTIGLLESFSPDFLQTLDVYDLCFLNTFWCNRFAKECSSILNAASAINSLDLWQDILDDKTSFTVSDEALTNIYRKNLYLTYLLGDSFALCQSNIEKQEYRMGENFSGSLTKDYSSYYQQLHNYIGKKYQEFFSNNLRGKNDFLEDCSLLAPFSNLVQLTYSNKNLTLEPLIKYCLDNPQRIKNWGLMRKELTNGEYVDSVSAKKSKVLMGFDIEGFNFPFRFHVPVEALMDLTKLSNGDFLVPEYQGAEDFTVDNELIPSNIIMPIPQRHEGTIIEKATNPDENQNFWEHELFLINQEKFPKHLSQTITTNKKRTVQSRLPICYTDLKTGERYCKINKKLQKLEDDGRNGK